MSGHLNFLLGIEKKPWAFDLLYGDDFARTFRFKSLYYYDLFNLGKDFDQAFLLQYRYFNVKEENRKAQTDTILAGIETTWLGAGWWRPTMELGLICQKLKEYFKEPGYVGFLETDFDTFNYGVWLGLRMRFMPG
jgi:hypothetical protein